MSNTQTIPNRKTVRLTAEEVPAFKKYMKSFGTIVEAAEFAGVSRQVLDRVMILHRGSPETIEALKSAMTSKGLLLEKDAA